MHPKCGCLLATAPPPDGRRESVSWKHEYSRANVIAGVEQSLRRLRTDYIDIVQVVEPSTLCLGIPSPAPITLIDVWPALRRPSWCGVVGHLLSEQGACWSRAADSYFVAIEHPSRIITLAMSSERVQRRIRSRRESRTERNWGHVLVTRVVGAEVGHDPIGVLDECPSTLRPAGA